jgi:hypothetical protein
LCLPQTTGINKLLAEAEADYQEADYQELIKSRSEAFDLLPKRQLSSSMMNSMEGQRSWVDKIGVS